MYPGAFVSTRLPSESKRELIISTDVFESRTTIESRMFSSLARIIDFRT